MICIVETQTANKPNFLTRERRKKLLHGKHVLGDWCSRVKSRAENLIGFYEFLLVECEANCHPSVTGRRRRGDGK